MYALAEPMSRAEEADQIYPGKTTGLRSVSGVQSMQQPGHALYEVPFFFLSFLPLFFLPFFLSFLCFLDVSTGNRSLYCLRTALPSSYSAGEISGQV
jgi:hypothetical protein